MKWILTMDIDMILFIIIVVSVVGMVIWDMNKDE